MPEATPFASVKVCVRVYIPAQSLRLAHSHARLDRNYLIYICYFLLIDHKSCRGIFDSACKRARFSGVAKHTVWIYSVFSWAWLTENVVLDSGLESVMSDAIRKVLHIDCDCFFAAVEMREQPHLRDVPIAIGGESDRRGVIATCNYKAREFGVRSAMATATARRLCPDLVLVRGRMELYREVSSQVMAILREYSPVLEQVSVDEAYLELESDQHAAAIAEAIRERVQRELGITVSVGGAPNKFLAKVASDWNKPNGQMMIPPAEVDAFVRALPVGRIPGVGPAFQTRLKALGIETCEDARGWDLKELIRRFGRSGVLLFQRSRGQDNRPLSLERERKSVSVERTYAQDKTQHQECIAEVAALYERWQERVSRTPWKPEALAPFVKVKFADFTQTTLADIQETATPEGFVRLLSQALQREDKPVRLLGIGGRFPQVSEQQLSLFD